MNKSLLISLAISPIVSAAANTPNSNTPNIILFLVDDMGWQDTSVSFYNNEKTNLNKRYHTPNMERMAQWESVLQKHMPVPYHPLPVAVLCRE